MKHTSGIAAAIVLATLPLAGAAALEAPVAIRTSWGVLIESLLNPSNASEIASPSLNFNLGAGVIMPFSPGSRFSFEPSADIYYYYAEWIHEQALPSFEEYRDTFVLGLLLDTPVSYTLPLGPKFTLGAGAGLCLDIRVGFPVAGSTNAPAINAYLWDKARFLMPSTRIRGEYALTDSVSFGFTGRVLWPIFNLWSGEGYGFFDQSQYLVDVTIRIKLGTRLKATLPAIPDKVPPVISPPTQAPAPAVPAPAPPSTP